MRRVVLDAAVFGRIVRRRDDDAIGKAARAPVVVRQNRMRDRWRRRIAAIVRDHCFDAVLRQHFECGNEGRLRQRVRVHTQEQRAVDALPFAVNADRLRHGKDMRLIERALERRAAMT